MCYAEIFAESCGQRIIPFVCQAGDVKPRVLKAQVSSHASSMSSMSVMSLREMTVFAQGLAVLTGCDYIETYIDILLDIFRYIDS